ncbi:ATP-binding cassette sub-family G member 4 isoform X2 [Musca domestica]|uniref:ATP-binding cassette sub-family G member 4 isoform X2 n=1 Tax=Musca domestica TaxID=7370 RepID=A0ABM3VD83_MUSDO|nr:ATP-binding cassette sub-family G member 4 isoform X2 [Musca domestica]
MKIEKQILNGLSGEFRAGELSAIIGPSGSGKTTLINLLASYRIKPKTDNIFINDRPLDRGKFRKISRYVLQEDYLCPHFTIAETMMMASKFKLNPQCSPEQRSATITTLLQFFNLQDQANTRIQNISGGELKRVCIAVELINKPVVIFLDEPTTGLDESTAYQCLLQLKQLSQNGHTVICTLHSPSSRLLQLIDNLYTMAEGQCVYQGAVQDVVQYLELFGLKCPISYNPADFLIEATTNAYGNIHDNMVRAMENGKVLKWRPMPEKNLQNAPAPSSVIRLTLPANNLDLVCDIELKEDSTQTSWWLQYKWLLQRILLQTVRDKINISLRIFAHLFLASLIGVAYIGIGRNAYFGMYNYHLSMLTVVVCVFTAMCPVIATTGPEMKYLQRQIYNQWYCLSSYFMALLTSHVLSVIIMSISASAILYFFTEQPMQFFRFALFTGIIFLTSMVASSLGLLFGARLKLQQAFFIGPASIAVFIILANYATERGHISTLERAIMYTSCLRHSLEGILAALFKFNRADLICPPTEFFCLMAKPQSLLRLVGSLDVDYNRSVLFLLGYYVLFTVLAYFALRWRLMRARVSHLQVKWYVGRCFCLNR